MHRTSKPSFDRRGFEVGAEHLPSLRAGPPAARAVWVDGRGEEGAESTATPTCLPQGSLRGGGGGGFLHPSPRCEGAGSHLLRDALRSRRSPGSRGRWQGHPPRGCRHPPPPGGQIPTSPSPKLHPHPAAAVTSSGGGRARRAALQLGSAPRGSAHPPPLGARPGSFAPLPASLRFLPRSSALPYPHPAPAAAGEGASAYPGACGWLRSPPPPHRAPPVAAAAAAAAATTVVPKRPPPPTRPRLSAHPLRPAPVTNRGRDRFKERALALLDRAA